MKTHALGLAVLCGVWVLSGCGGGGGENPQSHAQQLIITSGAPPSGTVGVPYGDLGSGFAVTSSGGVQPYHWTWAAANGSSLPPGLSFSDLGITGEPTAQGAYSVVITVTDSQSPPTHTSQTYAINVAPMAPLALTSTPPNALAGDIYGGLSCGGPPFGGCDGGFFLSAAGGIRPYGFSWAAQPGSSTPPGLSVVSQGSCPSSSAFKNNWRIICVPTTSGTYKVVLTVTDSASPPNQASANFTIKIGGPAINTVPPPAQGAINLPYSFQFTASDANYTPLVWSETGALPPGLKLTTDGTLSGTPTSIGSFPITMMAKDTKANEATPQDFTIVIGEHGFKVTGSMTTERAFHTATLLQTGKVLITGGESDNSFGSQTAELYDPAGGTFSATPEMSSGRVWHTATLLKDGTVLIAGGYDGNDALATAEIFDPTSGAFTATSGPMTAARFRHTATLLSTGEVLITGGADNNTVLNSAELFDPATGTFSATGSMAAPREYHTATALQTGKVLVAGGQNDANEDDEASAELYDPVTGTFSSVGNMSAPRFSHTATLLATGKVLIAGGGSVTGCPTACSFSDLATAELFDPASGTFSLTSSMAIVRRVHTATLLNDGTVLMVGGGNGNQEPPEPLASSEIFNPNTGSFSNTGSLLTARAEHTATLLKNGTVLVTGGEEFDVPPPFLASAEIYK